MSKQVVARKRQSKQVKKTESSLAVRDIMNKVRDAYAKADEKLATMSRECLDKECKLKG